MLKRITNIINLTCVAVLLFFGACRTKKQIISTKAVAVDTATAFVPDTFKYVSPTPKQIYIPPAKTTLDYYNDAYNEIEQMLNGYKPLDFKRAVFVTENAYFKEGLNYEVFNKNIQLSKQMCVRIIEANNSSGYKYSDSSKVIKNFAIYSFIKDTLILLSGEKLAPIAYDFDDFFGQTDWSKMFVVKVLETGTGNCHSLPYFYKILANELNTEAYLSLAPNHIYLKHRSKGLGWYNTELTSGEFPTDAWIKASGYISIESIKSGIYMDTLSQSQSVALCAYDLAKGYLAQTNNISDGFVIKCCGIALKYHSNNINAIILKAETLRKIYDVESKKGNREIASRTFEEMQSLYLLGLKLGYREMPKEMYLAWLKSVKEQKEKFTNSEIYNNFKTSKKK